LACEVYKKAGKLVIIGVGGISDAASAKKHFDAGADLVQVYTGLIYTGPAIVKRILLSTGIPIKKVPNPKP
jgi:dihydroorotate dehydrogenase